MSWHRTGFCCRCGACCKGAPDDADLETRLVQVAGYCPLFEWRADAPDLHGHCAGHEPPLQHPYYLQACKDWPTDPADLTDKPDCTYRFEWRDD